MREKEIFLEKASEHLGILPMEYDTYLWFGIITKCACHALGDITGCSHDRNSTWKLCMSLLMERCHSKSEAPS